MIYTITRTSRWEGKPCDEAKKKSVEQWEVRSIDEEGYNHRFSAREGLWRNKGKNHSTYNGGIIRRLGNRKEWVVEINSLEELTNFCAKYGALIISDVQLDTRLPSIEIYDDYRE